MALVLGVALPWVLRGEAGSQNLVKSPLGVVPDSASSIAVRLYKPPGASANMGLASVAGDGIGSGSARGRRGLVSQPSSCADEETGPDKDGREKHLRICGEARDMSAQDKSLRLLAQVQPALIFLVSVELAEDAASSDQHLLDTPGIRILDSDGNPHRLIGYALAGPPRLVAESSESPAPPAAESLETDRRSIEIDYRFELIGVDDLIERGEGIIEVTCHGEVFQRRFLVWSAISAVGVDWECGDHDNQIDATLILGMELPEDYATLQLLDGGRPVAAEVVEYDFWDDTWHVLWEPDTWPLHDPSVVARVETAHGRVLTRIERPSSGE